MPTEPVVVNNIRKYLKEKILYNKTYSGHQNEETELLELLQRTVTNGESNSVLLIGPKGIGKTTLVCSVLKQLESQKSFHQDCLVVKLHGLVHTNDRLALKDITTQMHLDNVVDGKVFGSFAENLAFLLACLKTGEREISKSVIFVLEEFDLFCTHHNQTLLYNLFDVSQSAQAPICIVGVTCRIDVVQLLEKRVKSRFSHRQMFLHPDSTKTYLDNVLERITWYLQLPEQRPAGITDSDRTEWNSRVEELIKNPNFVTVIERLTDLTLNERTLKNILFKVVCALSNSHPSLTVHQFEMELNAFENDDLTAVLQDLSALEISLIVAMKHHRDIFDLNNMNFEMIYTRYVKFVNKHLSSQNVQRPVVMKAFEHIEKLELISMMNHRLDNVQKEFQFFKLLVTNQQINNAISKMSWLPTAIVQWAASSLV